jgi:hypothetical protein
MAQGTNDDNTFYSDDLNAQVIAENNEDPDLLKVDDDLPVTTGEISLGDLDADENPDEEGVSFDEENSAGGEDNVVFEDDKELEVEDEME